MWPYSYHFSHARHWAKLYNLPLCSLHKWETLVLSSKEIYLAMPLTIRRHSAVTTCLSDGLWHGYRQSCIDVSKSISGYRAENGLQILLKKTQTSL